NKRVANILAKNNVEGDASVNNALLQEAAEQQLASDIEAISDGIYKAAGERDYGYVLNTLATLRPSIDAFFDNVMVMADDEAVRANRLALLLALRELFLTTADVSLLAK
ncbi:MAG: glycine--tRNA ligase subunit beta, partial [Aestuariibacter sp.]|nr:glycine--tRNA ligase subunit beta [Aestuariibacter sp.]